MSVNVLLASILRTASLKCFGHQTAPTFQQSKTALELAVMTTVKLINEAIRYVYGMGCLGDINERKYLFYVSRTCFTPFTSAKPTCSLAGYSHCPGDHCTGPRLGEWRWMLSVILRCPFVNIACTI